MNDITKISESIKLPSLDILLEGLPKRDPCNCGKGLPEVTFDFSRRTFFVWCDCGMSSNDMTFLSLAILDFNTKNKK